jgi:hypothetical protein
MLCCRFFLRFVHLFAQSKRDIDVYLDASAKVGTSGLAASGRSSHPLGRFGISFFGGFFFNGGRDNVPPQNKLPYLAWIGLGVTVFALGSYLLARLEQVRGPDLSLITVVFLMAPFPAIAGFIINVLGNYLRRTGSTTVQMILIGVGIFLLVLAGNWAWDLHQSGVVHVDLQAFTWPILADFGTVCLVLAALPLLPQIDLANAPTNIEAEQIQA